MKKITFFHEHLINKCFVSKTKLLSLILLILTLSSSAQTQIATGASSPSGLVVEGDYIYTVNRTNSSLVRANKTQVGTNNFETVVSNIARSGNQGNLFAIYDSVYTPGIAYGTMTYTDVSAGVVFPVYNSPYILNMTYAVSNIFYYNGLHYIANSANGSAELFEHYSSTGGNLIATLPVDYQYISDVTTDGSVMYFSTTTGSIYQIDLAATTPVATLVTSGLGVVKGIHFADDYLYFLNASQVRKVHKSTLVVTAVSSVPGGGVAMEIDGYHIYAANTYGSIYKINDPDFAPCTVNIPDANFKSYLLGNAVINTNGNAEIECSEASAFTGQINVNGLNISDLTGIEAFVNLTELLCRNNSGLTNIDVSSNTQLTALGLGDNNLTSIDVSNNALLTTLVCSGNQLTSLNIANGNNGSLVQMDACCNISNTNGMNTLACIQIDAGFTPPSSGWQKETTTGYSDNCSAVCTVTIPDANFKAALVSSSAINTNGNSEIECSEATAYTGTIGLTNQSISDLTGIEAFTNITNLSCQNNLLTSVNLSQNIALTALNIAGNLLTSLDLSQNTGLTTFTCANNSLTNLDLSSNIALEGIFVHGNALEYLNVANGNNASITTSNFWSAGNSNLTCVTVDDVTYSTTNWTNIDTQTSFSTNCPPCTVSIPDANFKAALVADTAINANGNTEIECSEATAFTGTVAVFNKGIFDLTGIEAFTNITGLNCGNNSLASLDVSANAALINLACGFNSLSSLDVSNNLALETLTCFNNQITSLDVSSNTSLTTLFCYTNYLSSLNVANGSNASITSFNVTSNAALTCIEIDAGFTPPTAWQKDATASYSDDCSAVCTVSIPDANFKAALVADTAINTNGNTEIECSEASAFTGFINIEYQNVSDLTGIEAFINMTSFRCNNNQITSLDLSANTAITYIKCNDNGLTSINLSGLTNLETLDCYNNSLTNIDVSGFTALSNLRCYDNGLTSLNTSGATALEGIWCYNNNLTNLDVSTNTSLLELTCTNNNLTSLNVSGATALEQLYCSENSITSMDVSANTNLYDIIVNNNALTSLNVANGINSSILASNFNATNNPNLTCIQVDDVAYSTTNWASIDSQTSFSTNCTLSVDDFNLNSIVLRPNPTTSILNIEMTQNLKQAIVYSMLGKEVLKTQNKQIDVSGLLNGVFLIKIEDENGNVSTKRFIKQ
ncbi:T9SS type A sorting domain-containing protein [Psychroserpens ponticola]|uniref:T9SS type A sorting domain-containing protein n=1 Tax=Psychroserpens ponticola TaxID=2932268 RepID=A0ABY7RWJ7_9FLAO|nr:T9SS type A sorting domain-containing protein [Psychroserpens ponticola]WCO01070.1 T9SS type A sorting domain-containing protein [Psychroserpens ponticola]